MQLYRWGATLRWVYFGWKVYYTENSRRFVSHHIFDEEIWLFLLAEVLWKFFHITCANGDKGVCYGCQRDLVSNLCMIECYCGNGLEYGDHSWIGRPFSGGFLFGLEGILWRELARAKDSSWNFFKRFRARLRSDLGLYSRTVLWSLNRQIGFLIGPMLLECVMLRGGVTGMSTMTAVDNYGEWWWW